MRMDEQLDAALGGPADAGSADKPQGVFITFEGGDGAGKSTHVRFLAEALRERGREVVCLREPGGTEIGEKLRSIVLDPGNTALADQAELLVYEAARAQIVSEVIKPSLERGAVVLCDRFADSTVAYQAYGRGLSREFVDAANRFACQGVWPQRTILMRSDCSTEESLARATRANGADRLELAGVDFHTRVNQAFLDIAEDDPQRVRVVITDSRKSVTAALVFYQLVDLFPWMADGSLCDEAYFERIDDPDFASAFAARSAADALQPNRSGSELPEEGR